MNNINEIDIINLATFLPKKVQVGLKDLFQEAPVLLPVQVLESI